MNSSFLLIEHMEKVTIKYNKTIFAIIKSIIFDFCPFFRISCLSTDSHE